jgi:hypothetical protein
MALPADGRAHSAAAPVHRESRGHAEFVRVIVVPFLEVDDAAVVTGKAQADVVREVNGHASPRLERELRR